MRTFVHKQKPTQQTKSSNSARSGRAFSAQSREVRSTLHLQRTMGNHAVQRLVQSNAEELHAESATPASTRFGHNFSRIPIFSPSPVQVHPKPKVRNFETLDQRIHPATIIQQARLDPTLLTQRDVLQLQRTIGNQAVGRLLAETAQCQPMNTGHEHTNVEQPSIQHRPIQEQVGAQAEGHLNPPQFGLEVPVGLPPETPAWTDHGQIHFGVHSLFATPAEQEAMERHEVGHALQQAVGEVDERPAARSRAEREAHRFASQQGMRRLSGRAVPTLMAHPPQKRKPFDHVWIGNSSIIVEIQVSGIAVRAERSYKAIGVGKLNAPKYNKTLGTAVKQMTDEKFFLCNKPPLNRLNKLAEQMKKAGKLTAELNQKIPTGGAKHRVALVLVTDMEAPGYRTAGGKGLIVVKESDIKGSLNTVRHETSHAIFEHHSLGKKNVPDNLALQIADIFNELAQTKRVMIPKKKFSARKPPNTAPQKQGRPAGLVMVSDTLWSGTGGHPWDDVSEFFASAFAGYVANKRLLQRIVQYYIKKADGQIKGPSERLFRLLDIVGDEKALKGLAPPAAKAKAEATLGKVKATPDWTYSEREKLRRISRIEVVDRLIDPTLLSASGSIKC
jgi:hypothetical protein